MVTGAAGFIGSAIIERLCQAGHHVIGIDNLNDYYDVALKHARLSKVENPLFSFHKLDISDKDAIEKLFRLELFDRVIHLAAQAGVRYSIENPSSFVESNLVGHVNILEGCRQNNVGHLVYASSSSVYGLNSEMPFSTHSQVDTPISLYAATKRSNELMSHSYSHLYGIPTTGLRFFTVYGPWGRPDMALFKFTKKILEGEEIDIYNQGELSRDFTYIDDIVEGVMRIQDVIPQSVCDKDGPLSEKTAPFKIYNIGNGSPVKLLDFVKALETSIGVVAKKNFMPMQPGDVLETWADTKEFYSATGYKPRINIQQGVKEFVDWYRTFYKV